MNKEIKFFIIVLLGAIMSTNGLSQTDSFNGLNLSLGNLSRLSKSVTRSISPENFSGEKGKGGMATEGTSNLFSHSVHFLSQRTSTLNLE